MASGGIGPSEEAFRAINPGVQIHAYDHTVGAHQFARARLRGIAKFVIGRASLQDVRARRRVLRAYRRFYHDGSGAIHFEEQIHPRVKKPTHATIDKVFSRTSSNHVFMKIDIEGMEYQIVDDLLRYADRLCSLVFEFHDTQYFRETFCAQVQRLQSKFHVAHIHGTNLNHNAPDGLPNGIEMTLAPGPASQDARRRYAFPIDGLDSPSRSTAPDRVLRFPAGKRA